jgi:hypothetical protein
MDYRITREIRIIKSRYNVSYKKCLKSRWVYFEAGALAKLKDAKVCNLLIDIKPQELQFPLAQFQHTTPEKDDFKRLLKSINNLARSHGEKGLREEVLERVFDNNWTRFNEGLQKIMKESFVDEMNVIKKPIINGFGNLIGIELLRELEKGLTLDEIAKNVISKLSIQSKNKPNPEMMAFLANGIKTKELLKLIQLGFINEQGDRYKLSKEGKSYFSKVKNDHTDLLKRFGTSKDQDGLSDISKNLISTLPEPIRKKMENMDSDSFSVVDEFNDFE